MKITLSVPDTDTIPAPPSRTDGTPYPFRLVHRGDKVTYADTNSELIGELIDGYDAIPHTPSGHDRALVQRYRHAVALATAVQVGACHEANTDTSTLSEDVLTALFQDRDLPFVGLDGPHGQRVYEWPAWLPPLVVIDMHYRPFTDRPAPTGNVVMLCPHKENGYLESMEALGLVLYEVADPAANAG